MNELKLYNIMREFNNLPLRRQINILYAYLKTLGNNSVKNMYIWYQEVYKKLPNDENDIEL